MKRIFNLLIATALTILVIACTKDPQKPSVEFAKNIYTVFAGGNVDVKVVLSEAAKQDLTVPLTFSGKAVKGEDYTVSSESAIVKAGETEGSVSITNKSLDAEKQISIGISVPSGYVLGNKTVAVVSADSQEALVYNFKSSENVLNESYSSEISVVGTSSGKEFKAQTRISIPLSISGPGKDYVSIVDASGNPVSSVDIEAGQSSAKFKVVTKGEVKADSPCIITVNTDEAVRFVKGEKHSLVLDVRGVQTPDRLVGTWEFKKILGLDSVNEFFMMSEDDPEALPVHNQGFTLTFTKNADGSVSLKPSESGDFANYFRECTISLATPKNTCANAIIAGKNSAIENNMFVSDGSDSESTPELVSTYYTMSKANWTFSKTSEDLKPAVIAFAILPDGKLVSQFREYTLSEDMPFGVNTFMITFEGTIDPEMISFPALFEKK